MEAAAGSVTRGLVAAYLASLMLSPSTRTVKICSVALEDVADAVGELQGGHQTFLDTLQVVVVVMTTMMMQITAWCDLHLSRDLQLLS